MNQDQERDRKYVEACIQAAWQDRREQQCSDLLTFLRGDRTLFLPQETSVVLAIPLGSILWHVRVEPNGDCIEQSSGELFYRLNGDFQHPT